MNVGELKLKRAPKLDPTCEFTEGGDFSALLANLCLELKTVPVCFQAFDKYCSNEYIFFLKKESHISEESGFLKKIIESGKW